MNKHRPFFSCDLSRKEVLAIVGLCKNAGKTSLLNWLIADCPEIKFGVMTTGRDGEPIDLAYGNPKPQVQLPVGTIFCCETTQLDILGSRVKILQKLPCEVNSRGMWIVEAGMALETEIIGPSTAKIQAQCAALMLDWGADKVLIDGSIDRKSIVLDTAVDAVFVVAGGSFGTIKQIMDELQRLVHLSQVALVPVELLSELDCATLKTRKTIHQRSDGRWIDLQIGSLLHVDQEVWNRIIENNATDMLYVPGALTEGVYKKLLPWLLRRKIALILRHPYNLKLTDSNVEQLLQDVKVFSLNRLMIRALVLNPWSVTGNHLDAIELSASMRAKFPLFPVIDIMEMI